MSSCFGAHSSSSQLRDENLFKSLSIRLDGLQSDINHLLESFHQPRVIVHGGNTHAMANLEVCVSSAERFVTTASNLVNSRLAVTDRRSEAGLSDQRRNEISSWIPLTKPISSEGTDQMTHVGSGGSITAINFDREHANLQTLLKFARQAYSSQAYDEAKLFLQRFKARSEARYGPIFEERSEVLSMLATTYCRLRDWKNAEDISHMNFEGREKALKALVYAYCEHGRWDDAERILLDIGDFESVRGMEYEYTLAELYLVRGYHEKAIQSCDKILQVLGDDHVLFYMSLSLLAQIYEAKGDPIEARLHRDLVPLGIEGIFMSRSELRKVCHRIDKLSRLWPDQAAIQAQAMWSTLFAEDRVPWDEIKLNIAHGSVVGSGFGFTLLHAFVKHGNELAIRYLIYKGADINAKTKLAGYTPLHLAIENHSSALVSLLLDGGADPFAQDLKGMSAWALAIYHGDEDVVRSLARGIDVNQTAGGTKPLMLAIEYEKESTVELLLKCGAQIEAMDGNGNTALINAARNSRGKILKRLLQAGANVDACNNHGVTSLMVATKNGSEEMVQALLEKRPNLEAKNHDGETALLIGSREGLTSIVRMLLKNGAECVVGYPRGGTPQDVAAGFEIVEALQQARTKKKGWLHRFKTDEMDQKYHTARLAEVYKIHEEREMRERRHFTYIQTEDEIAEEEQLEREIIQKRLRKNSIKISTR